MSAVGSVWGPRIGEDTVAWDADLDAIAALSAAGLLVKTGANTWVTRTLQAPAAGFTITNPAGTAGYSTFVLANDLAALEALASTGLAARTAADTWAQRSVAATSPLTAANGNGVSGNPTLSIDSFGPWTAIDMSAGTVTLTAPSEGYTWELVLLIASSEAVANGNISFFWNGETTVTNYWQQQAIGNNGVASVTETNNNIPLYYSGSSAPSGAIGFNRILIPGFRATDTLKAMYTTTASVVGAAGTAVTGSRVTYRTGASSGAVNDAVASLSYTLPNAGTHPAWARGYHRWLQAA